MALRHQCVPLPLFSVVLVPHFLFWLVLAGPSMQTRRYSGLVQLHSHCPCPSPAWVAVLHLGSCYAPASCGSATMSGLRGLQRPRRLICPFFGRNSCDSSQTFHLETGALGPRFHKGKTHRVYRSSLVNINGRSVRSHVNI